MKKNILKVLSVLLVLCTALCACGKVEDQTIACNGLTMTLPGDFKDISGESEAAEYHFAYSTSTQAVFGLYEEKALFESYGLSLTLQDYCDLLIEGYGLSSTATEVNGLLTIQFNSQVGSDTYSYLAAVYETEDLFWLIQCGCESDDFSENYADFLTYLSSVNP